MKKNIICSFMLVLSISSFCQQSDDYLEKSRKQKTGAWVLLGGGAGLCTIGGLIAIGEISEDPLREAFTFGASDVLAGIGTLAMLGSIPLFIASAKNKRKGISLSLISEPYPQIRNRAIVKQPVPSLSLKISI